MNTSLLIRMLMVALGLILTASALRSTEPVSYQLLLAMWVAILGGVAFFWWRERSKKVATKQPARAAEPEEELLPDIDNGILSALDGGPKDGMAIHRWLQLSGWQVGTVSQTYDRINDLQRQAYVLRSQKGYKITDAGSLRLLRDRARRQGTQVHTTNS